MELLESIHHHLGELTNPTLKELAAALKKIPNLSAHVKPFIKEPEQLTYGRNVIYQNDSLEVIIINLPPNKETAIHDHGESIGCAMVLEGKLLNSIYQTVEGKIEQVSSNYVNEQKYLFSTKGLIHKISNTENERMISMHVYTPPLQNMTNYQEQKEMQFG